MRIKPQFIGNDLNVTNYADQCVAHLKSLKCWELYASGKASIGRKSSLRVFHNFLIAKGFSVGFASQFIDDLVARLRVEQRGER